MNKSKFLAPAIASLSMKKIAQVFAIMLAYFILTGCASSVMSKEGTTYQIGGPVKNYEVLGLVYVKCKEGEGVYQALLRAAENKGGNGITNVMMDIERKSAYFLFWKTGEIETRYASALAIKYNNENITTNTAIK